MKTPSMQETPEQKRARIEAEKANINSIQKQTQQRTSIYQRIRSPRVSLVNGARM